MKKGFSLCQYCYYFTKSPVIKKQGEKKGSIHRKCFLTGKKIFPEDSSCKDFAPANLFWCQTNNYWVTMPQCVQRRYNEQNFNSWRECKKCRQFEDIENIIRKYVFQMKPRKRPDKTKNEEEKPIRIKRRTKSAIKRRPKKEQPKIKRRQKPIKIKRRKRQ